MLIFLWALVCHASPVKREEEDRSRVGFFANEIHVNAVAHYSAGVSRAAVAEP